MLYVCVGIVFILSLNISLNKSFQSQTQAASPSAFTVPSQVMQHVALGYNHFAATWLWFEAIAYYGSNTDIIHYDYLAHELHTIIRLNPKFEPVYYMAASVFPWGTNTTNLSQSFTTQAMFEFPNDWRWAYYRGFNSYWFDHNNALAAHFFEISAMKPNAPPLVSSLAVRMHSDTGNIQTGLNFLKGLLQKKNDSKMQAQLLKQYHYSKLSSNFKLLRSFCCNCPNVMTMHPT